MTDTANPQTEDAPPKVRFAVTREAIRGYNSFVASTALRCAGYLATAGVFEIAREFWLHAMPVAIPLVPLACFFVLFIANMVVRAHTAMMNMIGASTAQFEVEHHMEYGLGNDHEEENTMEFPMKTPKTPQTTQSFSMSSMSGKAQ